MVNSYDHEFIILSTIMYKVRSVENRKIFFTEYLLQTLK